MFSAKLAALCLSKQGFSPQASHSTGNFFGSSLVTQDVGTWTTFSTVLTFFGHRKQLVEVINQQVNRSFSPILP